MVSSVLYRHLKISDCLFHVDDLGIKAKQSTPTNSCFFPQEVSMARTERKIQRRHNRTALEEREGTEFSFSGPDFWGLLNQEWGLCSHGKFQSPIDVVPRALVYDHNLKPLRVDKHRVDGSLTNTGHDIVFEVNHTVKPSYTFSGGPLCYTYTIHQIKVHFGKVDQIGSEHSVAGRPFPLELQLYGYNSDLYVNFSEAKVKPHGIAAMAIFGMISSEKNSEFEILVQATTQTRFKGDRLSIGSFSILSILPNTESYLTYDGSFTQPSCMETVTWIIFNKPLHITKEQLFILRQLHKAPEGTPQLLMENNFRPPMPMNRRTVRTNIAPKKEHENCGVKRITFYEVNDKYKIN
ncbi:putative carbonic anhydrase-like protein 1 [Gigantopelta aegis]|uniref:putative carbonic anhydrase-like protein 1 n=1 Tax=Gigantopelta aegis TaxID=1735272 RepID=UPI001B88B4BF|nr:putative carbonic anhydrase-like protein 1 [Gigantopelta aegis]